jgi:hypothetical protein
VGRLPQGAGIAARVAARALPAAAEGAAYGAAREVRTGESRAENAGLGALAGVGGRALAGVAGKALAPAKPFLSDSARRLAALAEQYGVPLSPADLSNSPLLRRLANLPGSGRVALAEKQSAAVNREIANTIGVDAPRVDAQVYAAKKVADSRAFNDLTARNNLTVTPDLVRSLKAIQDDANVVGGDAAKAVSNAIDGFYARMDSNGIVPGRAYQSLDSALGGALKSGGENAHYIGQVRSAIRDAMDNSIAPADREAWATLRQQYGDRKTIRDLVSKGQGEDISPRALMGRVTANNSGKERMASGTRGKMGDLAMLGQQLKPPPTSGTAENELAKKLWNPLNWPGMAATSTAGHLANSPALARRMVAKDAKALAASLVPKSVPRKYAEKYVKGYLARLPLGQHPDAPLELNIVGGSPMPAGQLDAQLRSQGY